LLVAQTITDAGQTVIIGYCAILLFDKLSMLSNLYAILTGDKQEELEGTLQRLRNTIGLGISNAKWRLGSYPSVDPSVDQGERDV